MTIDEYKAARVANGEQRLKIMRVLDAAGLNGYHEVEELARCGYAVDSAFRELDHEGRMTVLTQEREERTALLAKLKADDARRAATPNDGSLACDSCLSVPAFGTYFDRCKECEAGRLKPCKRSETVTL